MRQGRVISRPSAFVPLFAAVALLAACGSPPPTQDSWQPRAEIVGLANGNQELALYLTQFQRRPSVLVQCERVLAQPQPAGTSFVLDGAVPAPNWGNPDLQAWLADARYKGVRDPEQEVSWFPFLSEVEKSKRMYVTIENGEAGYCSLTSDSGAGFRWSRQSSSHGVEIMRKGRE